MTNRIEIGGIILEVKRGGSEIKMSLEGGPDSFVWSWPRISSSHFPTMGEELAQALANIDGTFYVLPRRDRA